MKTSYKVDKGNRVVIAKIRDFKFLNELLAKHLKSNYHFKSNTDDLYESCGYYKGISRCNEKDTFNPDYGKKIASTRASIKYHKDMIHDLETYYEKILKYNLNKLNDLIIKEKRKLIKDQKHLLDLLSEENNNTPEKNSYMLVNLNTEGLKKIF